MMEDRNWWQLDGAHYKELAAWLREVARKYRLPNPQNELLRLARTYERRSLGSESAAQRHQVCSRYGCA
jgi:hypothetical protein